ncbi:MAG: DegQ family serine endoprotease [Proteobacteria bacterium]|nr:DegQ family serine endoprotease [Pseudomonadota bacterium]
MGPRILAISLILAAAPALAQPAATPAPAPRALPQSREQVQLSFAPVVRKAAPAVVNVFTRRVVRTQNLLFNDPFFRQFFGDAAPFGQPSERIQNSLGSGVIVGPDGLIVTNHHVIKDSDEIRVVLADRREFDAALVRSDDKTDLAVLKINVGADVLPYLELRDSDDLEVGDLVLAIGNPFGVGQTVTSGIVSALARTTGGITDYRFFIQTDAAINPGNSGGALITLDGKLAGVNTAIFSRSGGSIGIGFAIPSNMVRTVVAGGASGGRVVRPWLGASGQSVTAEIAGSLGLSRPQGVLVNEVYAGGPADRAGLRVGDIVTQVEGHEVDDAEALRFRIATLPLGRTATVSALRQGRDRQFAVALIAPPETPPRDATPLRGSNPLAGATVANLSPALADEMGLEGQLRGVIVLEVRQGSPANRLRLARGDVVLKVNDRDIAAVKQLEGLLSERAGNWRISVRRGREVLSVVVSG